MKKIAPTLEAVSAGKLIMPDLRKCPAAKAELRALLAVVRAWDRYFSAPYDAYWTREYRSILKARARLDKLGGGQ